MTRRQQIQILRASGLLLGQIAAQTGISVSVVWNDPHYKKTQETARKRRKACQAGPRKLTIFLNDAETGRRDQQLAFRAEQKGRQLSQYIRGIYRGRHIPRPALDFYDVDDH